eukprot:COSAG02_NODE_6342_length_3637_cov_6.472583_2_plen_74_part_00
MVVPARAFLLLREMPDRCSHEYYRRQCALFAGQFGMVLRRVLKRPATRAVNLSKQGWDGCDVVSAPICKSQPG